MLRRCQSWNGNIPIIYNNGTRLKEGNVVNIIHPDKHTYLVTNQLTPMIENKFRNS
jgi:hypothetical protein